MPTEYSKEIINQFIPGNGVPSGSMPAVRDDITRYGGGMMLSGVINDNGEIFNFFNKNHHVSDSGKSFMYDIMEQSGMGEHSDQARTDNWTTTYGSRCVEQDNTDYRPSDTGDPEDPDIDIFLNSNQIIDLAANSEIALDLGNHIDHNDDNCFYRESSDTIIDSINHGGIYQFCILFPMYYYEINTNHPDWWKMSSPYFGENMDLDLYPSRQSDRCERLWYNAVTSSVNNGTRQWAPESSNYYITDYLDGYSQGNVLYHPYQTYKVPGLVFECYKQCRSSNYYVIQSLNEFDDHQTYQVSEAELNLILRGVQYGLRVFAEACIYDYGEDRSFTNMMRYLIDLNYPNNPDHPDGHWFRRTRGYNSCEHCRYNVFSLDEPNTDLINGDPDSVMMQRYLEHMGTVEIDGNTYPTDSLDINGDPYEEYKFPVFVTCTGDQGFDEDIELDDLSGESELEIIKNWMDDSCRAVRPPYIEIDLYILLNSSPVYFKTLRMTESDRVDERTWRRVFTVPRYINGNPITYIVQERNIYAYDDNHSQIGNVPVYDISYSNIFDGGILGGLVVFGEDLMYTISITNTANTNNIEGLGEIHRTVHITKVWEGFKECDSQCNCRAEASGILFAGGKSYNWDTDHHPIGNIDVTDVLLKDINTGNYITETPGSSWFSVISHSDSYLEWQVTNICSNYSGHPIDDSDRGGVFFFEIDQECISLADDNMVQGFGVSGNWRQSGSRPLVYKICYHPDNFTEYTPGSVDYYKWLNEGWTPYIPGNNLKDNQGNLTAGSEYESITPRNYSGEDIIVPYNANFAKETGMKARIYIAAERPHHDSLGTFELSTFSFSGNQSYNKYANNVPYPNNQSRSVPLRCGGYINSLYGISMSGEELWNDPENIQDGDVRLGIWNNWVNTKWLISNIRVNGSNKYSKQYVFSNTKASDYGNARVDDWIHSKREFRLSDIGYGTNYIGDSPERWALGGIQESEVVQWYDSGDAPQIDDTWLYFTMPQGGTITLTKNGTPTEVALEYSLDNGSTWTTWVETNNVRSLTLTAGQTMHVRNTSTASTGFSTGGSDYYNFTFTADTYAGGNTNSLLCKNPQNAILSNYCYRRLFFQAQKLITPPLLPAKNITTYCYQAMFQLSGITTPSELPATELKTFCYGYMYNNCPNLQYAPNLPAKIATASCYYAMFNNDSLINEIHCEMTDISAPNCLNSWLTNVSPTGNFYCSTELEIPAGISGIPSGWTRHDISEYPANNQDSTESYSNNISDNIGGVLKGGMYSRLFEGNHNLVDASQLVIPLPYCDLMYFRTFADTGLIPGNTTPSSWISSRISTSTGIRKNEYYPQWASPEDSSKVPQFVFGALKGMYAGCKRIVTAYPNCIHDQYTNDTNNPLIIGMHYFDSMFSGVTGLRTCYMFKPIEYSGSESGDGALGNKFPWGACMNMFANTHGCWYNIIDTYGNTQEENWNPFGDTVICQIITDGEWFGVSMISNAIKVEPHAFRGMFQSSNACYYTYHNDGPISHQDAIQVKENFPELHTIPAFVYANMFNGSSTNYPLGHSEVGDGSATHTSYHGGIGFDTKLGPGVKDTGADAYIGHIGKGAFWGMFKDSQIRYCTFGGVGFYSGDFITYDNWAFGYMFDGCTKLGYINGAFKLWSSEGISHKKWVRGVTNNKSCTFMRNNDNRDVFPCNWPIVIRGNSYIPSKWSVVPGVGEAHVGQHGWDPIGNQSVGWQHGYVL